MDNLPKTVPNVSGVWILNKSEIFDVQQQGSLLKYVSREKTKLKVTYGEIYYDGFKQTWVMVFIVRDYQARKCPLSGDGNNIEDPSDKNWSLKRSTKPVYIDGLPKTVPNVSGVWEFNKGEVFDVQQQGTLLKYISREKTGVKVSYGEIYYDGFEEKWVMVFIVRNYQARKCPLSADEKDIKDPSDKNWKLKRV